MSVPQDIAMQPNDFVSLIKSERKDSAKERKEMHNAFLDAIKNQTNSQNLAMKTLGDRIERQMESMRSDLRSMTNRIFWIFAISLLVVASLAGVAVKFKYLQLTPQDTTYENNDKNNEGDNTTRTP